MIFNLFVLFLTVVLDKNINYTKHNRYEGTIIVLKFFISFATKLSIYLCIINFNLNSSYFSVYLIYNGYYNSFITIILSKNVILSFQFASSHGGSLSKSYDFSGSLKISIHTLTRRVTHSRFWRPLFYHYFNPHPHMEDDFRLSQFLDVLKHFNPHPHVEGDAVIKILVAI